MLRACVQCFVRYTNRVMISVKYANDEHMDALEPTSEPSGGHGLKSVVEVNSDVFVGDRKFVELRNTVHETTRLRNFSTRRDHETPWKKLLTRDVLRARKASSTASPARSNPKSRPIRR